MLWKIVFLFVISAATTTSVCGLQCYSCASTFQPACAVTPLNTTLFTPSNCTADYNACIAFTFTVGNLTTTQRGCASTKAGAPCDLIRNGTVASYNGTLNKCYSCQSDLCNSSSSWKSALALVLLLCVFQFAFSKLYIN